MDDRASAALSFTAQALARAAIGRRSLWVPMATMVSETGASGMAGGDSRALRPRERNPVCGSRFSRLAQGAAEPISGLRGPASRIDAADEASAGTRWQRSFANVRGFAVQLAPFEDPLIVLDAFIDIDAVSTRSNSS